MPLANRTTPANGNERAQVVPLLDTVHLRTGKRGRPRKRPKVICLVSKEVSPFGRPLGASRRLLGGVLGFCHHPYLDPTVNRGINSWKMKLQFSAGC
jgi:hypothetical protein